MSDSTKINEAFIKNILTNCSQEEAIRRIAQAMTNRDTIIRQLQREK